MCEIKITREMIDYVASLAHLRLDEPEKEKYADELGRIIRYADMLNELDISSLEPGRGFVSAGNAFREDREEASLDREILLGNAPACENGFFKVPGVIGMAHVRRLSGCLEEEAGNGCGHLRNDHP